MKKSIIVIVLSVIMIVMSSCGGNKHSKAFNDSKKIIDRITKTLEQAESCAELDSAAIKFIDILSVEGIANLSEEEQNLLSDLTYSMQKVLEQKQEELDCKYENLWDMDEEMPLDEPFEEEE